MRIPTPQPGLVIRYAYLWRDDHSRGLEEGHKERPCAVVLAVRQSEGTTRVVVVPVTHRQPAEGTGAIPVPPTTAKRLGLDEIPQWIVTREVNVFTWPGPDIRPVPGSDPSSIAYGHLPHALGLQVIAAVRDHVRQRSGVSVERDEH